MRAAVKTCYWKLRADTDNSAAFNEAAALIRRGETVAFPTETVYGLGANGLDQAACAKIFAAKGRPSDNPLILHVADFSTLARLADGLNANAKALIKRFMPGPITLIVKKAEIVPDVVSAGLATVAVRFPANTYAQKFIRACACPIAAPSANLSGRPSPTNAGDVLEDMDGRIAGILDGGECAIGLESTIVDTTEPVPVILRPGGVTYEMLLEVLGAVDIDPALRNDKNFRPKAPGMKYRHYAPKAPMYLLEAGATGCLPRLARLAVASGLKVGVLCDRRLAAKLPKDARLTVFSWGDSRKELAGRLFYLLRGFDRICPDVILAAGVAEDGIGLAIMNRMRKAAGQQLIALENGRLILKNGAQLPAFMIK